MNVIMSIAQSGMLAATQRLELYASNVTNAGSDGPLPSADPATRALFPAAYVPVRINQVETPGGGTAATFSNVLPSYVPGFEPTAPFVGARGLVASPNVDFANEAIQQVTARYAFAMNAQVVRTYSQMMKSLIDIKS
jgi:flagellar basal-body rod protein FlgC